MTRACTKDSAETRVGSQEQTFLQTHKCQGMRRPIEMNGAALTSLNSFSGFVHLYGVFSFSCGRLIEMNGPFHLSGPANSKL